MPDIYDLHEAAFANVSAFVIAKNGERVATIAFKFPRDGAGRLYAYVHWLGLGMQRGYAGGYGYDKRSAAVAAALKRISESAAAKKAEEVGRQYCDGAAWLEHFKAFHAAASRDDGHMWDSRLRDAGFEVWQAV